ncbi:MAG: hypothetical protein ABGY11_13330, partial [Candidatus Thioglobus sp.]
GTGASQITDFYSEMSIRATGAAQIDATHIKKSDGTYSTINNLPWSEVALTASPPSNTDISFAGYNLLARSILVGSDLSGGPDCDVQFDTATITVSTCPVPAPWSFIEITIADGVNTSQDYYFASAATQLTAEIDATHITWDSAESYFTIANAGFYEFEMQGSVIVNTSPVTITTSIVETTGLGGTETEKIVKNQLVRANIDPHDIMIKWVGEVAAGTNYTCKFNSGSGVAVNMLQKGSTFTCKRIN